MVVVLECDCLVIVVVNGFVVGWGMEFVLFVDICVVFENVKFGELFIKCGLIIDVGGLWCFFVLVGFLKVVELVYIGDVIDVYMVRGIGFVGDVVLYEDFVEYVIVLVKKIVVNVLFVLCYMKEGMWRFFYGDFDEIGGWVSVMFGILF